MSPERGRGAAAPAVGRNVAGGGGEGKPQRFVNHPCLGRSGMGRRPSMPHRLTLALRLADGSVLPVEADAGAMIFIGRYARLPAFGPPGSRLRARVVAERAG